MSATRYKKPHVDILICIEMTRERNQGIKKNTRYICYHPLVLAKVYLTSLCILIMTANLFISLFSVHSTDDGQTVPVPGGLPPQVDGQIRCFCKLTISQVVWSVLKPPDLGLVRVKWWGEEGDGVIFW